LSGSSSGAGVRRKNIAAGFAALAAGLRNAGPRTGPQPTYDR